MSSDSNSGGAAAPDLKLTFTVQLLAAYLSSGRNETMFEGRPIPVAEAAVIQLERLMQELEKKGARSVR